MTRLVKRLFSAGSRIDGHDTPTDQEQDGSRPVSRCDELKGGIMSRLLPGLLLVVVFPALLLLSTCGVSRHCPE